MLTLHVIMRACGRAVCATWSFGRGFSGWAKVKLGGNFKLPPNLQALLRATIRTAHFFGIESDAWDVGKRVCVSNERRGGAGGETTGAEDGEPDGFSDRKRGNYL